MVRGYFMVRVRGAGMELGATVQMRGEGLRQGLSCFSCFVRDTKLIEMDSFLLEYEKLAKFSRKLVLFLDKSS